MKTISRFFIALATAFCAVSCMDLGFNIDVSEITKDSYFVKEIIGKDIDPLQNWNLAQKASVTITTPSDATVKVYAVDGEKSTLVINKTISGTETVYFDAKSSFSDLYVVNMKGGSVLRTNIGGKADFSSTKTVLPGNTVVKAELVNEYIEFNYKQTEADVATAGFSDVNNAVTLYYSETGTFTINPVWYTSESGQSATIGLYYYDSNNNKVDVPLFQNDKENAMLQYQTPPDWGDPSWQTYYDAHMPSIKNTSPNITLCRSKGIKVTLPTNTIFGFYIVGGYDNDNGKFYSEVNYNQPPKEGKNENPNGPYVGDDLGEYSHVAVINVEGRKYLAWDDWCELGQHSKTNPEYKHLVFGFNGDIKPLCDEENSWILACEDLGEVADYDFNDVVFSVSHVVGSTEATVKFLACGGTLLNDVWWIDKDDVNNKVNLGEIHNIFGIKRTTMVNTISGPGGERKAPVSKKITVPEDFSMADDNMGGFCIIREDNFGTIAAPGLGSVPYMICVPADWRWPEEFISIVHAYPTFSTWCNDHTKAKNWYENFVEEYIYSE